MNLEFPPGALTGPGPATVLAVGSISTYRTGAVARRLPGAKMATMPGMYEAFASAWDFPSHFGANKDAFDDSIRDLPTGMHTPTGAVATGYLTVIEAADKFLAAANADDFAWFATSVDFWREHYRSEQLGFGLVLLADSTTAGDLVARRWEAADAPLLRLRQD
ncbi:barstar family protein [Gordonia sp. (in: high G+C Gram-positive bacteria)]|uniref:barstar family protein n=1 Tax=Gordonia sp. (in: high G+C Gram-positive bacteria) TaxID=84139 RepID=UPI003C771458